MSAAVGVRLSLLVAAALVPACGSHGGHVQVSIDATGTVANVVSLRVTAAQGARMAKPITFKLPNGVTTIPPKQDLLLLFDPSTTGPVTITVEALDGAQKTITSGMDTTTLQAGALATAKITFTGTGMVSTDMSISNDLGLDMTTSADLTTPSDLITPSDLSPAPITWGQKTVGTNNLRAVWGSSANNILIGGVGGVSFRSIDSGGSWNSVTTGVTDTISSISGVSPTFAIAASGASGVLRWLGGTTWSGPVLPTGATNMNAVAAAFGTSEMYTCGSAGKIFYSTDAVSWTDRSQTGIESAALAFSGGSIYIAANPISGNGTILQSGDRGATWTPYTTGTT